VVVVVGCWLLVVGCWLLVLGLGLGLDLDLDLVLVLVLVLVLFVSFFCGNDIGTGMLRSNHVRLCISDIHGGR